MNAKAYSYVQTSPGYCQLVLKKARRILSGPKDRTDFSDVSDGHLGAFDVNERAALREISKTSPETLRKLGILSQAG